MLKSQAFLKRGKKIIQEEEMEEAKQMAEIRDLFITFLGKSFNKYASRDIFDWEISFVFDQGKTLYALLDRLGDVLDFISNQRDDVVFEEEEGMLVANLVIDSSGELPIKELTEVMQTLIEKGLLKH